MNKVVYHDVTQGSPEWVALRCGMITASNLSKIVVSKRDGGFTKTGRDYLRNVFASQLMGQDLVKADFANFNALQWGKDQEPFARAAVQDLFACDIKEVGAYVVDGVLVVSPDGVAALDPFNDGVLLPIEIKCPYNTARHVENIITNAVPDEYELQVQAQLMALQVDTGYFASYDPRFTAEPLHVIAVKRDDALQAQIRQSITAGLAYIDTLRAQYEANRLTRSGG